MQEVLSDTDAKAPAKEKPVSEEFPELYHYTSRRGLEGIYKTQSLWASRFEVMNDPGEFLYAKRFYVAAVAKQIEAHLVERRKTSLTFQQKLEKVAPDIAAFATDQAAELVEDYYDRTISAGRQHGEKVTFCVPYITSFCSHTPDMKHEQENGLLSQWRWYGRDGGFAVVFDTLQLEKLIWKELERFDYVTMCFFDVQYDEDPRGLKGSFNSMVDMMAAEWVAHMAGENMDVGDHFEPFLKTAPRLKHRAFFEEREVRIVAYPAYQEFRDYCNRHKIEHNGKLIKPLETSVPKPHVSLFEGLGERLPIKRIIVGPSKGQKEAGEWVRALVGDKIEVRRSETPFRAD